MVGGGCCAKVRSVNCDYDEKPKACMITAFFLPRAKKQSLCTNVVCTAALQSARKDKLDSQPGNEDAAAVQRSGPAQNRGPSEVHHSANTR